MIKPIAVEELQPGIFVHRPEVWWLQHKQSVSQRRISDPRQIAGIPVHGIRHLRIDPVKTVPPPAETSLP